MFRQQGRGDERKPVTPPLPPDLTLRLDGAAPIAPAPTGARRQPAHSREERRLARIDRKVAERDSPKA
ncbi:MAG: hypothetical protein JWM50_2722 [Microbacteriaceae bacterium]|jgi:hypothetical protein|nr:hypothetical protein [Microbacteriaceae bacterium]